MSCDISPHTVLLFLLVGQTRNHCGNLLHSRGMTDDRHWIPPIIGHRMTRVTRGKVPELAAQKISNEGNIMEQENAASAVHLALFTTSQHSDFATLCVIS